jgi:hypothetical protein
MPALEKITISPASPLTRWSPRAWRAAGAAAARLCGVHALLARASGSSCRGRLSRGGAQSARLLAGRAPDMGDTANITSTG